MGAENRATEAQTKFLGQKKGSVGSEQLTYYTHVADPLLGQLPIYCLKNLSLCFVAKLQRHPSQSADYEVAAKIQDSQCSSLVSLFGFRLERHHCCASMSGETVVELWEYYNFYFADYLQKRSSANEASFIWSNEELWHILKVCCDGWLLFERNNICLDLDPSRMVVSPEGKLKLLWAQGLSTGFPTLYERFFLTGHFEPEFLYAPEEIAFIARKEWSAKLDSGRASAWRLGLILLSALTHSNIRQVYRKTHPRHDLGLDQFYEIDTVALSNLLGQANNRFQPELHILVKRLLALNPKDRPILQDVSTFSEKHFNDTYELTVSNNAARKNSHDEKKQEVTSRFQKELIDSHIFSSSASNKIRYQKGASKLFRTPSQSPTKNNEEVKIRFVPKGFRKPDSLANQKGAFNRSLA